MCFKSTLNPRFIYIVHFKYNFLCIHECIYKCFYRLSNGLQSIRTKQLKLDTKSCQNKINSAHQIKLMLVCNFINIDTNNNAEKIGIIYYNLSPLSFNDIIAV